MLIKPKCFAVQQIFSINTFFFATFCFLNWLDEFWISTLFLWNPHNEMFCGFQLITYQFIHIDFLHYLLNMICFLSIGNLLEKNIGYWKFWFYFLFFGTCAGVVDSFFSVENSFLIGSSGSIWGLLILLIFIFPNEEIFNFGKISIKLKWIILFALCFEIYSLFEIENDGVSHIGHIGGACGGLIVYHLESIGKKLFDRKLF